MRDPVINEIAQAHGKSPAQIIFVGVIKPDVDESKIKARLEVMKSVATEVGGVSSHRNVLNCRGIKIGRNVWIGARATIMPGVTVGDNAVIAGGALVVKDVTPDTVVDGVPAKFLKTLK